MVIAAFDTVDWWIVGFYVLLATLPGFLCRKYIRGQADFLVAGRTLSVFLATATLTATEMGLVTVMYMAEFGYRNGFSAMVIGVIAGAATLFIGLTGFMVKGMRRSKAATVAEYYQMRYSRGVRLFGGLIIAIAGILNYGVFLQIEATFIRIVMGMPEAITLSTSTPGSGVWEIETVKIVMTTLLLVVLSYTLLGGMVSVVLTDYVQFIVLTIGFAAATWWVFTHEHVLGFQGMVEAVQTHRPEYGVNPFIHKLAADGETWLGVGVLWILWQCMHWLGTNTWQTQQARTAASDSVETTRSMWILTSVNFFGRGVIPMVWGIGAIAFLSATMTAEDFAAVEHIEGMPIFLSHLPTGLIGFLMAGMLAALMSTHSSYLLAWSSVLTEDLFAPVMKIVLGWTVPTGLRIWITRVFIVLIGAFILYFGLWFQVPASVWGYLAMTGTIYVAGSMTLVACGLYWKRANATGAYLGLLAGALPGMFYLFLHITSQVMDLANTNPDHWIEDVRQVLTEPRVGVISFPLAFVAMYVGSKWANRRRRPDEPFVAVPVPGGEQ